MEIKFEIVSRTLDILRFLNDIDPQVCLVDIQCKTLGETFLKPH